MAVNASDRTKLMDTALISNIREKDPLSSKFNERFAPTTYTVHKVTIDEESHPELVSYREYGTVDYWWLILKINGVIDADSLQSGEILIIPDLTEYVRFFRRYKSDDA